MEMVQVTEFIDPGKAIHSQHGYSTIKTWLEKEAIRIMQNPGRSAEVRELRGKVALYVDDVCQRKDKK